MLKLCDDALVETTVLVTQEEIHMNMSTRGLATLAMLFVGVLSFTLCDPAVGHAANHIKSLTVITEVFGDGQNISAAAIEYDKNIDNGKLSSAVFTVMGRTITKVYTSDAPTKSVQGVNGRFVVLELSVADPGASVISQRGRTATDTDVKVSVTQAGDVLTTDGE